jgi:hypothetical protein
MSVELLLAAGSPLSPNNGGTNTPTVPTDASTNSLFVQGNLNGSLDLDGITPPTNYRDNAPPGATSF